MFLFTTPPAREPAPVNPVVDAIRQGAEKTGTGFDYLLATAQRELALDPKARARSSSASGLFQFIEQTWLGLVRTEGPKLGLGDEANAIAAKSDGTLVVDDPRRRREILALRHDPQVASLMAGTFTQRNRDLLAAELGREPTSGDLYVAHFLGARGAVDLIRQAQTAPRRPAAAEFPDAAAANRPIFFDRKGRARGAGEVYALLAASHGTQVAASAAPAFAPDQPVAFARERRAGAAWPVPDRRAQRSDLGGGRKPVAGRECRRRRHPRRRAGGVLSALDAAAGRRRAGRARSGCGRSRAFRRRAAAAAPAGVARGKRGRASGRGAADPPRRDRAPARPPRLHELAAPGMIIRQFLLWARTAPPGQRAEAVGALARAYLYSELSPDDRWEAETAMTALLDDPSPLVRRALAEAFANAPEAPRHLVVALANDQSDIATLILSRSPVLPDADLVDCAALGGELVQTAIALRPTVSVAVSAALAEIASAASLAALAQNAGAAIPATALARMVERHGDRPELREALLARADLPLAIRQAIAAALSASLSRFVTGCGWLSPERTERIVREAREKTTLALSSAAERGDVSRLVLHLRRTGQLTPALILRALLSRSMGFAEAAFADLSGLAPGTRRGAALGSARGRLRAALQEGRPAAEPAAGLRGGAFRASREWAGRSRCRRRAAVAPDDRARADGLPRPLARGSREADGAAAAFRGRGGARRSPPHRRRARRRGGACGRPGACAPRAARARSRTRAQGRLSRP